MVKSKKMSKGSLAVIILAVLLVLSMVLGLTGAWFTDKKNGGSNGSANFGKVSLAEITDTDYKVGEWTGTAENNLLVPGSSVAVSGGTITNDGTVSAYVLVDLVSKVAFGATEWDLTAAVTKENGVDVTGKTLADYISFGKLAAGELATGVTYDETNGIYKIEATKALTINGFNVELKTALPNTLTIAGTDVTFNGAADALTITVTVKVAAIQAANIEPAAAKTQLAELVK